MLLPGAVAQRQFAAGGTWSSEAVQFSADTMTLSSTNSTRYLSGSCWIKWQGSSANYVAGPFTRPVGTDPFHMYGWLSSGTDRRFEFFDNNGTRVWRARLYINNTNYTWNHVCWSMDAQSSANSSIYFNGVKAGLIDITATGVNFNTGIRLTPSMPITYSDFWLDNSFVDMNVAANRAKFMSSNAPVDLGYNGQTPTGSSPLIFMSGPAADWNALDNKGTGATPTLTGSIVDNDSAEPIVIGG